MSPDNFQKTQVLFVVVVVVFYSKWLVPVSLYNIIYVFNIFYNSKIIQTIIHSIKKPERCVQNEKQLVVPFLRCWKSGFLEPAGFCSVAVRIGVTFWPLVPKDIIMLTAHYYSYHCYETNRVKQKNEETEGERDERRRGTRPSIKSQTVFLLWECKQVGEVKRWRRRWINGERRKWNERTGVDGLVVLIKVWIFTALSSPRLNTNYSQQLLNELTKTHYHNVLHVYHFGNTELCC